MRLWKVRGQEWTAPAPWHLWLPPPLAPHEDAGPSDCQGAGVTIQTQGGRQIWRCVHVQYCIIMATKLPVISLLKPLCFLSTKTDA